MSDLRKAGGDADEAARGSQADGAEGAKAFQPIHNLARRVRFVRRLFGDAVRTSWIKGYAERVPYDRNGKPCAWITYPALYFLESRNVSGLCIFEYGSGQSTLWWSERARTVVSVEHDPSWHKRISARLPANVTYLHETLVPGGAYCRAIESRGGEIDVAVIDGVDRNNCARACANVLPDRAVIIWDNSEREEYGEGIAHLLASGYRKIDFFGYGPANFKPWCTTVFYKPGNCLEI